MKRSRIIARLDVKGPNVIKGVHLECLRIVGDPQEFAEKYYLQGADELIYIDIVASLYGRDNLLNIVKKSAKKIFIPFTVGGGVRTLDDIQAFLRVGADKVAINTAITKDPELITKGARKFGSQCIVASIEAKKVGEGKWEAYTDCGREKTGLDVIEWAKEVEKRGAGEILLTSIDTEGTKKGFDMELNKKVVDAVSIPVILSGGAGSVEDVHQALNTTQGSDSIALASVLHYDVSDITTIKKELAQKDIAIREKV